MSLRARLVFGAAAAVAIAIVLASVLVYFLVQDELRGQVDQSLREQRDARSRRRAARFAPALRGPKVYELFSAGAAFGGYYQLVDAARRRLRPRLLHQRPPLLASRPRRSRSRPGARGAFYYDTQLDGQDTRVFTIADASQQPAPGRARATRALAIQVVAAARRASTTSSRKIRLWLFLVALGGVARRLRRRLARRALDAAPGARPERDGRAGPRDPRPQPADQRRAAATS